jgi:carbamate kinase
MRIVVALGGNALLRRNEAPDVATQRRNIDRAVSIGVAPIARRHDVIITHGNGPQIGLLALRAEADPLDLLGAESEGMIGYLVSIALANALPGHEIVTLLTQVEVDPNDPAFAAPRKPIGSVYTEEAAHLTPWTMIRDGAFWRRGVASPEPRRIREIASIRHLLRAGVLVVCAGGGGIPVIVTPSGGLAGVEAVIDKDLTAALLAEAIDSDVLLILTDVPAVWTRWPMAEGTPIHQTTPEALRAYTFAGGSMGPKVDAACRFVERTGRDARIGAIEQAEAVLAGTAGTLIRRAGFAKGNSDALSKQR